jgi:hypothetical protein
VIGIPWIAVTVWAAAGLTLGRPRPVRGLEVSTMPLVVGAGAVEGETPPGDTTLPGATVPP